MSKFVVCLVAVASAIPQGPSPQGGAPLPPPTWFLKSGLTGSFSERTAVCREIAGSTPATPTLILIPEDKPAEICINFPARTLPDGRQLTGGWRHDIGEKGACANGCCSFNPPTKKARQPAQHTNWFETSSDCSSPSNVNNAPFLFQGSDGESKNLCVEKDGSYSLVSGTLSNCGPSNCCILYEDA